MPYLRLPSKDTKLTTNYLDDFLFLALTIGVCNERIQRFLDLCSGLNIPVADDKTEWGCEVIVFLGILLDGRTYRLGVPLNKREKAIKLLKLMLDKKKATVKQLQALCGYLNFLGKAIFPGRTFTRRMYAKFGFERNGTIRPQSILRPYHHVRLDNEFKQDCRTWLEFLQGELSKVVSRPVVDLLGHELTSEEICFYSDASGSVKLGYGCILNTKWLQGFWDSDFMKENNPSIEFLELYALAAGLITWQNQPILNNCRVTIFCDNTAVVQMINTMASSCPNCMNLLRVITLSGLRTNRRVYAKYVDTKSNYLADSLSRGQWTRFRQLGPQMNLIGDTVSEEMNPIQKFWSN